MLVSPITRKADDRLNMAWVDTWLPEGRWTDIFNGRIYQGGQWVRLYRDLDAIPVLAKEGAIVPMYRNAETNDLSLTQPLIAPETDPGSIELPQINRMFATRSVAQRRIFLSVRFTLGVFDKAYLSSLRILSGETP